MTVTSSTERPERLQRNQLSLFGVIMPGLAQVAPAFNLFFTTGVMVGLAGASAPLIFLISMVAMGATASSLAQFSGVYPSAGSFITYITRAIGTKVAVATGVICVLGYIIAFGGIYIFVGSYIVENVFNNVHFWGVTQLVTILYGVLVVAPVVVGLKFGVRVTVVLYVFEVVLLLALSLTILAKGGASGLSGTPFTWPGGKASDVLLAFSFAVLAFGGFEAAAPLAEETRDPRRTVPIAVLGCVLVSGIIYVVGSYALVTAFGVGHTSALAARREPVPHRGQGIPAVRRAADHVGIPVQRDQLVRGGQHPDLAGRLRRRPRRAAAQGAGRGEPAVQDAGRRGGGVRRAKHPDRRGLDGVHRSGHGGRAAQHLGHPRADPHVPGGQRRPGGRVGEVPPPRHPQERMAVGGHSGDWRGDPSAADLGRLAARPAEPAQHPAVADHRPDRGRHLYALILGAVRPQALERAPALLEGEDSLATDPLPIT